MRFIIPLTVLALSACASAQLPHEVTYLGERIAIPNGFTCGETGLEASLRPEETHRCFFSVTGPGSEQFNSLQARASAARSTSLAHLCKEVRVISDEPAKESVYLLEEMPRLQRVGLRCIE